MAYTDLVFPGNLDFFQEVADGDGPENLILAQYVNKLQNALLSVENRVRYTGRSTTTGGSFTYTVSRQETVVNSPGPIYRLSVPIDPIVAAAQFNNRPFDRTYGVFVSAWGYVNAQGRSPHYYPCTAAFSAGREDELVGEVGVFKRNPNGTNDWRVGEIVVASIMLIRP